MNLYKQFFFESYNFDAGTGLLELHYALDDRLQFTETYRFDFPFVDYDPVALDRALQSLFFMAGVSYYKTFVPREIIVHAGQLDEDTAHFFSKTYRRGLGEFWYVNNLDPHTPVHFPVTKTTPASPLAVPGEGLLVGLGGGKDSLVSIELLRNQHNNIATWSLNHRQQLSPLVQRIGLPHYWVERVWDRQLFALNEQGALNGHIPISAIFACVGVIVAILTGRRDNIVSNEQSANEETLSYKGASINHQYSKTQEFERDFQHYLKHTFGDSLRYYSLLRPFSELHISEIFAKVAFQKYKDVFSSCNRAFVHGSHHLSWCGECSKCAFVFLMLTPFLARNEVERLWNGKNLLLDKALVPKYKQLLGIEGDKPLDCVGEVKESRAAMHLAQQIYPELTKMYHFYLPPDYDFRELASHEIPAEIHELLNKARRVLPTVVQPE